MENKQLFLHLSLIDGIGPVTVKKLVENKPDGFVWSDLYSMNSSGLVHQFGITPSVAQKLINGLNDTRLLEHECALIEKYHISYAVLGGKHYPTLLSEIHAPPPVLYWKGLPVFNDPQTMAIIGSRRAHRYAEQTIEQIVPGLVQNNWVIVSGGALGADSMAHYQTVQSGGKTVVVLGSGLLHLYPSTNRNLFDQVVRTGGALVSSFPLQTQARPGNFPARNRIISGLSKGCVVVQAAAKSGARITAQFALEQGREVFAVPGLIGDELSSGCHALIQQGAKLINGVEDILNEFSFSVSAKAQQERSSIGKDHLPLEKPQKPLSKNIQNDVFTGCQQDDPILSLCASPISADDLALKLGVEMIDLQELLFDLQLSGALRQNFAGLWERAR